MAWHVWRKVISNWYDKIFCSLYLYVYLLCNELILHSSYVITHPLRIPALTNICSLHCTMACLYFTQRRQKAIKSLLTLKLDITVSQWRTQKIFMGGSFSGILGHLYLLCAVCDVTIWRHFQVSNPTFCEVCWHNMHIRLHALPLIYVSLNWI